VNPHRSSWPWISLSTLELIHPHQVVSKTVPGEQPGRLTADMVGSRYHMSHRDIQTKGREPLWVVGRWGNGWDGSTVARPPLIRPLAVLAGQAGMFHQAGSGGSVPTS